MKRYSTGYTTGVYDLFHIGHLNLLCRAKSLCDTLIVGVTTDELVAYKKTQAVICFEERKAIVAGIRYVDRVVAQENMDKLAAWERLKFDAVFVGDDWKGTKQWDEYQRQFTAVGVDIVYLPYTKNTSSTRLRVALDKLNRVKE